MIRESHRVRHATCSRWSPIDQRRIQAKEIVAESSQVFQHGRTHIGDGSVLIAAITSCTNTSNPSVMIAAGLLRRKQSNAACASIPALKRRSHPGRVSSRITWRRPDCRHISISSDSISSATVARLASETRGRCIQTSRSDRRIRLWLPHRFFREIGNFEARVHQHIKANFLMSPPLVVAFALAGRVHIDLSRDPLANNAVERVIDVGYQPDSIALNPTTHSAYVSDLGGNDVSVLLPPNSSTTAVSCDSQSAKVGSGLSCSATVSGASPTGMVNWTASAGGSFSPASCALSSGKCSVSFTPSIAGTQGITATYLSDANNTASLNVAPLTVSASPGSSLSIIVVGLFWSLRQVWR